MAPYGECSRQGCSCKARSVHAWTNNFKATPAPKTPDGKPWCPPGWTLLSRSKKLCCKDYNSFNKLWDAAAKTQISSRSQGLGPLPRPSKGSGCSFVLGSKTLSSSSNSQVSTGCKRIVAAVSPQTDFKATAGDAVGQALINEAGGALPSHRAR